MKNNYTKNRHCKCGTLISNNAKKCKPCAKRKMWKNPITRNKIISKIKGKNCYNYIDGRTFKPYYCIDCGKGINWHTGFNGGGRCQSCAKKGELNYNYGNRVSVEISFCQICGKKLSHFRYKFCKSCAILGERHYRYGKNWIEQSIRTKGKTYEEMYGIEKAFKIKQKLSESHKGRNNYRWIDDRSLIKYPIEFSNELKEHIRDRDNYICQLCHISEEEHKLKYNQVLNVHHIDYNKQNCQEENLIALCKRCNVKVNYNRVYWVKYFKEDNQWETNVT